MRIPTILLSLVVLVLPASAAAAPRALPPVEKQLTAAKAAKRTCATRVYGASARGVDRTTWTAPMSGYVNVRIVGGRSDWDLTVFDAASRGRMGSSQAFGSTELVQTWVASGQRLAIQGCRRSGPARQVGLEIQLIDLKPPKRLGTPSLVRVRLGSAEDLHRLEEAGLDVTHNVREGTADVVLNTVADRTVLRKTGLAFSTRIADLTRAYHRERLADLRYAQSLQGKRNLPSGNRTTYRELGDYETELKGLAEQFPSLVKPVILPKKTIEGRTIDGVEIASGVNRTDDGRPVYFVVGVHHAREWPAAETTMEYAHLLAKGYGSDPRITDLLDKVRVVIVPVLNKDGFHASREASKTYSPRDRCDAQTNYSGNCNNFETVEGVPLGGNAAYRRKNCRGIVFPVGTPCELQNGVDPNRNYGEGWGGIGATMNPYGQTYRGTGPWSEPETQAVHEYTRQRAVTNLITVHNVAALVLRPPGRRADGLAPDEPRLRQIGDAMADATGYTSQYGWQLYDTSGTTEDWNYAAAGTFGYTIEIGPARGFFHMRYQRGVVDEWNGQPGTPMEGKGLREAYMVSLESAANPADHSVLAGSAPAGRVLHLRKEFQTMTSPVCQIAIDDPGVDACHAQGQAIAVDDFLDYKTVVPTSGTFEWHVTPSTRPFVATHRIQGPITTTRDETFTPGPAPEARTPTGLRFTSGHNQPAASTAIRQFNLADADAADELVVDLTMDRSGGAHEYGNVEDYDVYLYYKGADGQAQPQPIGTPRADVPPGGALIWVLTAGQGARIGPGQPEQLIVKQPPVGQYELRIVNRAGTGDSWKARVRALHQEPDIVTHSGITEAFTLTCESADGQTVYGSREVIVGRGERLALDLGKTCKARGKENKPPKGKPPSS